MRITELRSKLGKTVFPIGYAHDKHADMYSVYLGTEGDRGRWAIYLLYREEALAFQDISGTFTGMTLEEYMEGKDNE